MELEEQIQAAAKEKAEAIIKREKNLDGYINRLSKEVSGMMHSAEKEEAQITALQDEADKITARLAADNIDLETPEAVSMRRRLEYIVDKSSKHNAKLFMVNMKSEVYNILAKEENRRLKEKLANLQKEYAEKQALLERLQLEASK